MIGPLGPVELVVVAGIALLLFGKRLPSVMRSLGKGVVEFKKGVRGIEEEMDEAAEKPPGVSSASDSGKEEESSKASNDLPG